MTLGNKLLSIRKAKQIDIDEIEDALKVRKQTIRKWEKDYVIPNVDKIVSLCKLYNVSIEELLLI